MATLFSYAILFFYCAISLSATTLTIQPGKTPGEALGSLREVPHYSWKHTASGKTFRALAYTDQEVWGTMPPGEYEIVSIDLSPAPKAATAKKVLETSVPKTEIAKPENMRAALSANKAPSSHAIPQSSIKPVPGVDTLKELDEKIVKMRQTIQAMTREDKDNPGEENPKRVALRAEVTKVSIERDKVYDASMSLRVRRSEEPLDPYAQVKKIFDSEIKDKVVINVARIVQNVRTFQELKDFHIAPNCNMQRFVQVGSVVFDCATIGMNKITTTEVVAHYKTRDEIMAEKDVRMKTLNSVIIKVFAGLVLISLVGFGFFLYIRKQGTAHRIPNTTHSTVSTRTPPAAKQQHQLATSFDTPGNVTIHSTARPARDSGRYGLAKKLALTGLQRAEPEPDAQVFLQLMAAIAVSANSEATYKWRDLVEIVKSGVVVKETEALRNGVSFVVSPLHKATAMQFVRPLLNWGGRSLICIEVWDNEFLIVPDSEAIEMARSQARAHTQLTAAATA